MHIIYSIVVTILAVSFIFFDISHFVKTVISISFGRIFQRKYKIGETTFQYGICTIRDVDLLCRHMNNARFLRAVDFARSHFCSLTGIYDRIPAANLLVGATTIRYRKPLQLFSFYKIETKILCWDKQCIYIEHKIITLSDNFVRAIVLSRSHVVYLDLPTIMVDIPDADFLTTVPDEVTHWEQCLETSSSKLRRIPTLE